MSGKERMEYSILRKNIRNILRDYSSN